MRSWLVPLLVALVGCAQDRSPVRGTYVYRYPDGSTVPVDVSAYTFQAYVSDGTGFSAYPAAPVAGTADGTFEIPDVPDGPVLVRRSFPGYFGQFTAYDDHEVIETFDVLGRPDAQPSSASTRLHLDANGLAAWHAGDWLVLDCFGNASEIADPKLTPALAANATAIHASVAWGNAYSWGPSGGAYLMDPAAGDALLVTHETAHTTGDLTTWSLTQTLDASAPAQVDGQSATVSGAFADVDPTARLTATMRGDALAPTLPPGTIPGEQRVSLLVGPGTRTAPSSGPSSLRCGAPTPPPRRPPRCTTETRSIRRGRRSSPRPTRPRVPFMCPAGAWSRSPTPRSPRPARSTATATCSSRSRRSAP